MSDLAQALFAPRSVALVGASGDAAKNTARPRRYLRKLDFSGNVFLVNATRKEISGEKTYPSMGQIPAPVDHAFIMVEDVEAALEDCGAKRVPVASIFSDGFADAGPEGAARQAKLVARARELGVRLLGPNSMGVIDVPGRMAVTVSAVLEMDGLPPGNASIVSQSGTMLGTFLSRGAARGIGFAKLVSLGNESDIGAGEIVDLLVDDAATRVILLFLETVRDARRLAAAARRAHAAGKPVVAYKLGRSRFGEALARSHTGALAGSDAALDAYFRDCGILRVDLLETLIEIAPLVAGRSAPGLAAAPRIAVVTTTGGGAATVVDRLGVRGLDIAFQDGKPVVDLTMAATPAKYTAVLDRLLDSPQCDAVLAVVGSSAQFQPELAVEPILRARRGAKPLAVFMTPNAERSLALLAAAGIPAFRTPEACADAFAAFFGGKLPRWRAPLQAIRIAKEDLRGEALLSRLGIPVAASQIARAPDFAHSIPYPVAAKRLNAAHKTETGGVMLEIPDRKEFLEKARALGEDSLLVQAMERGLAEAIVGYQDDLVVGPIVLVGAGGVLAEIYGDFAVEMAPVGEDEALDMIGRVKGLAAIRGYRNLPRGDVQALAGVVSAFSRICLLEGMPVKEAEINPVIVKPEGVVAVDALVVTKE